MNALFPKHCQKSASVAAVMVHISAVCFRTLHISADRDAVQWLTCIKRAAVSRAALSGRSAGECLFSDNGTDTPLPPVIAAQLGARSPN